MKTLILIIVLFFISVGCNAQLVNDNDSTWTFHKSDATLATGLVSETNSQSSSYTFSRIGNELFFTDSKGRANLGKFKLIHRIGNSDYVNYIYKMDGITLSLKYNRDGQPSIEVSYANKSIRFYN